MTHEEIERARGRCVLEQHDTYRYCHVTWGMSHMTHDRCVHKLHDTCRPVPCHEQHDTCRHGHVMGNMTRDRCVHEQQDTSIVRTEYYEIHVCVLAVRKVAP